jgi:hypothetical protein
MKTEQEEDRRSGPLQPIIPEAEGWPTSKMRGNFRSGINQRRSNFGGGNNYYSGGGSFNYQQQNGGPNCP